MARWTAPVQVRITGLPQFKSLLGAVADLLKALAQCEDLPEPVWDAADRIRRELAALGGRDIGPPPGRDAA